MRRSLIELLRENRLKVRCPLWGHQLEAEGVVALLGVPLVVALAAFWMFLAL